MKLCIIIIIIDAAAAQTALEIRNMVKAWIPATSTDGCVCMVNYYASMDL